MLRGLGYSKAEGLNVVVEDRPARVGGIFQHLPRLLMIINQVHISGISIVKSEYNTPISRNGDSPIAVKVAGQTMQPIPGTVQTFQRRSAVKSRKDAMDFVGVFRRYALSFTPLVKATQAVVADVEYHYDSPNFPPQHARRTA